MSTSRVEKHPLSLEPVRDRVRRVGMFLVLLTLVATSGWQAGRVVGPLSVPAADAATADHLHADLGTP